MTAGRDALGELAGFTVGVTAARRADELAAMLARKGAEVQHGQAIRIVPLAEDRELYEATTELAADPVDFAVVTTGIGFRGWVEAAEGWGLGNPLLRGLRSASVLARGPKAVGAVRAAGLSEAWAPESESNAGILEYLIDVGVSGRRVAVQLHGERMPEFTGRLRSAGAEVIEVPVYRWAPPADQAPLDRLLDAVLAGQVDALTFTSAPATASVLDFARVTGRGAAVLDALRGRYVLAACVGEVCADPLLRAGVPVTVPDRARIGSLVRTVADALPRRTRRLWVAGRQMELRGQAAIVSGELRPVPPTPMAVLRALAAEPGKVVSRRALIGALPNGGETHAVETAIARLRVALGVRGLVQTVVKRGYRLAMDSAEMDA